MSRIFRYGVEGPYLWSPNRLHRVGPLLRESHFVVVGVVFRDRHVLKLNLSAFGMLLLGYDRSGTAAVMVHQVIVPYQDSQEQLAVQVALYPVMVDLAGEPFDQFWVPDVLVDVQIRVEAVLIFEHGKSVTL